jgi:predicted ribosomally synthesized peptide with nif11-like leader
MSVQDFKKFGQLIAQDEKVRAKAKEIGVENVDGQIQYAKTLGLEFTKDDLAMAVKEASASSKELTEEQLEKVAGGAITSTAAVAAVSAVVAIASLAVASAAVVTDVSTTASRDW